VRAPALRELQAAFWRALATPGEPDAGLLSVIRPSPALAPGDRVGIYAGMYLGRIVDALREDFPKLAALLGDEPFADLVRDYLGEHPSVEPSIRHVGGALPAYVAARQPGWLADVARLEWARLEVFDAPDETPLSTAALLDVPAEDWPGLRFTLVPAFAQLVAGWPVHRLWSGGSPPFAPARTALRIWREGFAVYQTPMDVPEEAALDRLAAGEPFSAVCEPFDDPADAASLLLRWLEDGIVARAWAAGPESGPRS
jgi:Putative DNA-binding domain